MNRFMKKSIGMLLVLVLAVSMTSGAALGQEPSQQGITYEVGPGKSYERISDVPLGSLEAGDTVLIHWKEEPYKEKFWLRGTGTAEAPITVKGVPGPNGELPVIDGNGAVDASNDSYSVGLRALIKVGGVFHNDGHDPAHIIIENLHLTGAYPG